jgi:peptidoglycan/LPS O-acetylase OafA/YrhL
MKVHLEKFDFLRGVAILSVFFYHSTHEVFGKQYEIKKFESFFLDTDQYENLQLIQNFLPTAFGWSGVQLFLIISGFLIHFAYLNKQKFNHHHFFNRRFWRIWPPYFIALIFFTLTVDIKGLKDFIVHALLLHNLTAENFDSINPSFWSLALEAQLYLLYPLFLFLRKKAGIKKLVFYIFCLHIFLIITGVFLGIDSLRYNTSVLNFWIIWALGAYLAELHFNNQRITNVRFIHLAFCMLMILTIRFTFLYYYLKSILFSIFFVLFIDWILNTKRQELFKGRFFNFVTTLGLCSYSLYLFHQPHLGIIFNHFQIFDSTFFLVLAIILSFLFFYALSYFHYKTVELASINYGQKFYIWVKKVKEKFTPNKLALTMPFFCFFEDLQIFLVEVCSM